MLAKFKKAQSTAEYAILLSLVVAAIMGVQNYVKRGIQARVYEATNDFITSTGGTIFQYSGTSIDKRTTDSISEKEFIEDPDDPDTPFTYTAHMESRFRYVKEE